MFNLQPYNTVGAPRAAQLERLGGDGGAVAGGGAGGRNVQPALAVIGRHYVSERDSVPVQYNGVV